MVSVSFVPPVELISQKHNIDDVNEGQSNQTEPAAADISVDHYRYGPAVKSTSVLVSVGVPLISTNSIVRVRGVAIRP
jgi:hypothetical protein